VSDNNSSDSTQKITEQQKNKGIRFVQNGGNLGFAKGINSASKNARGETLLFINPDATFISGDFFSISENLVGEIVVVGGKIIQQNGQRELSCGKFYTLFNVCLLALGLEEKIGVRFSPEKNRNVDWVSGGFMMVKRSFWEKMGGFDENLFMYVEDMEFCFRVKKEGFKIFFSNDATIKHIGQASSNKSFAVVNIYKGLFHFHKKHMGTWSYYCVKIILKTKSYLLVLIGKILNNKYLADTYASTLKL